MTDLESIEEELSEAIRKWRYMKDNWYGTPGYYSSWKTLEPLVIAYHKAGGKSIALFEDEIEPYIDIVFDGPPGHESGRFVEVENQKGVSIGFGNWVKRPDGYWVIRFTLKDVEEHLK